jgi:hypothetical protein
MQQLANDFRDKEVTVVIVNGSEPTETMRPVYAERAPEMTVVDDATGEVSHSYSGDAVPYTFVLDAQGTILDRMPYTFETATAAVNQALGLAPDAATPPKTGAG